MCTIHTLLFVFALLAHCRLGNPACLPDAIPAEQRQEINIDGQQLPLGVWSFEWNSGRLYSEAFKILATEKIGVHVSALPLSGSTYAALWAVVGCAEGGDVNAPADSCAHALESGTAQSSTHLLFETWDFYLPTIMSRIETRFPQRLPEKLGSVGYEGVETYFTPGRIVQHAMEQVGLGLDLYRSFNASWHEPSAFFDSVTRISSVVEESTIHGWNRCDDLAAMTDSVDLTRYVELYGDDDFVDNASGRLRGKCINGTWWASPACRGNLARCVPMLSRTGWGLLAIMHKATAFNMPIAYASLVDSDEWVSVVRTVKTMLFWWVPDVNFIDMDMRRTLFPFYNADQYKAGILSSDAAAVKLEKYAHPGLEKAAPDVHKTARNMRIAMDDMKAMLMRQALEKQRTTYDIACEFLRRADYEKWIPGKTECNFGEGLLNGECVVCLPSTYSVQHPTVRGSRLCVPCQAGNHQDKLGQNDCKMCEPGTFANEGGQSYCQRCPIGTYADAPQSVHCLRCHDRAVVFNISYAHNNNLSTSYEGSRDYADCRCDKGSYRSRDEPNVCQACHFGTRMFPLATDCPVGSQQETTDLSVAPKLKEGYMAYMVDGKIEIFRCRGTDSCIGSRRLFNIDGNLREDDICLNLSNGIACSACEDGAYFHNGRCRSCSGLPIVSPVALLVTTILTIAGVSLGFYYESMFPPNPISLALGNFLSLFQSVSVIAAFSFSFNELIQNALIEPSKVLGLNLTFLNLPPECVFKPEFLTTYALRVFWVLQLWLCFAGVFFCLKMTHKLMTTVRPDKETAAAWLPEWRLIRFLDTYCRGTASGIPLAERVGWFFDPTSADIINATVKTTNVLYITIVQTSMMVFRYTEQPSGVETLQEFPAVVVPSDDWSNAIPISCAGLILLCVGFLAFFTSLAIQAPRRIPVCPKFRQRYRGLWVKFDPSSWWFGIVQLTFYGMALNITPACTQNARAQIMAVILINSAYILVVCHVRPWKWQLNHLSDLLLKIAFSCFCLFTIGGNLGEEISENTTNVFMLISLFLPISFVLVALIRYAWMFRIHKIQGLAERAAFTERFLDLSNIVNGMDVGWLRAMTVDMLDRDVRSLDNALDSLQYNLLGLQQNSILRMRADAKPFQICYPGRLEGEVMARGLERKNDCRGELRLLQEILRNVMADVEIEAETTTSWTNRLTSIPKSNFRQTFSDAKHDFLTASFQRQMRHFFKKSDSNGDGELDRDEFCDSVFKVIQGWTGPNGEAISRAQLGDIFDYIDVNQGGSLSATEFHHGMRNLPDPIFPSWATKVQQRWQSTRKASTKSGTETIGAAATPCTSTADVAVNRESSSCLSIKRPSEQSDSSRAMQTTSQPGHLGETVHYLSSEQSDYSQTIQRASMPGQLEDEKEQADSNQTIYIS